MGLDHLSRYESNDSSRPDVIREVSEPVSRGSLQSFPKSPPVSALSELIRNSPPIEEGSVEGGMEGSVDTDEEEFNSEGVMAVTVDKGIISQPTERTGLLLRQFMTGPGRSPTYDSIPDLESQKFSGMGVTSRIREVVTHTRFHSGLVIRRISNPKSWNRQAIWHYGFCRPIGHVPPVVLGLLLNILDALSYGMILFPLGEPIFANLGPDGISMFYVSCIVSQLVYSLGGSVFRGGIGSEMIEVVPFFHKMAFTILARVGQDNPKSVLATTIISYSLSSVLTGAVFFLMGKCKLGSLIGFFPRHILIGCIGGVGWFLVATGLEVSARLDGSLEYNMTTFQKLIQGDTIFLWTTPLALALTLLVAKHWIKYPLVDAAYFLSIIAIFYFFVAAIPNLKLPNLRGKGWVFEAPDASIPFYHFYSLYDFKAVDWEAVLATVPAMLSLTFFGILHVPINIPALGLTTGEDNVDVDRELRAHGISNTLSGFCGSIQNYLVYTNTVLFMRSGGDSRFAGVMLAVATFGVLVAGPVIIGFIPIMVVGALIFFLGFDLMREALVDTWGRVHRLEYLTIIIIVVTMAAWDFVIGILVGILLACVSSVLQTSQVSAIRGSLPGGVANSTVRRHPIQHRFLQQAGRQIHVMKLAGYLFFGTIVGVEKEIRNLLLESFQTQRVRFLVLDLYNVDGVDFSAAEAFTRINRVLNAKDVKMIVCSFSMEGEMGRSLCNVGLFDSEDAVQYFESLNSALEYCENYLLKAFYEHQRNALMQSDRSSNFLDIPARGRAAFPEDFEFNSPRRHHLLQVATTTLSEQDPAPLRKWQDYKQPLQLILKTFSDVSDKPEEFWYRAVPFFIRREFSAGAILYDRDDRPNGFYLLELGMLKAEYKLQQGKFSELIVSGTTCGELPFFSGTNRTSTTAAETDCVTWVLDEDNWEGLQETQTEVAQELLKISLKLTSERMDAITKYMLLTSG